MWRRQPFPGPGLAVRILGGVTRERVSTLQAADAIVLDEIRAAGSLEELFLEAVGSDHVERQKLSWLEE